MDGTKNDGLTTDNDLFVVRSRMADDRTRAAAESLARIAGRAGSDDGDHGGILGARAWLGRRLVAAGTVVAGDRAGPEPNPTTGQPC
jgi:hypothetical protein